MKHLLLCAFVALSCGCLSGFEPRDDDCADTAEFESEPSMLAIGDSAFAYRSGTCRTMADIAALELGRSLRHRAVNGARVTGGSHPIVDQYEAGDWDWVLVSGGGNDLNTECVCGFNCDRTLNGIVSAYGIDGQLPDLVDRIRGDGAKVLMYGYFEIGEQAHYGFDECLAEIDELRERQEWLAKTRDGVYFVDGRDAVTIADEPEGYAFDDVHASPEGARLVGELIAETIRAADD